MNRSIPFVLSLALFTPAAFAEDAAAPADQAQSDQAQSGQAQSDQAQSDQAQSDQAGTAGAAAADDQAQPAAGRQGQAGEQDPTKMFIKDLYSHNLYEIQISQHAQKTAQDEKVKQFAQMLVKDHTQANTELKQIAQSAGVQVEEKLDKVHQAKLEKAQQCSPAEFTRKYTFGQAAGHMMSVLELTYQSKNAQDQKVKQFAAKMLPKMKQHLDQATELATAQASGMAGGDAQPASAREPAERSAAQPQEEGRDATTPSQPGTPDASEQPAPEGAAQPDAAGSDSQAK